MKIVVNHLTRMTGGHICVAGVDLQTGRHVRPVIVRGQLTPEFLARHGGPFDMAHVVELGRPAPWPKPPHVEDCIFDPSTTRYLEAMEAESFWAVLVRTSRNTLEAVFGAALREARNSSSCCTDPGQGIASLGCLVPRRRPHLHYQHPRPNAPKARIRIQIDDGQRTVWAAVTDLRLYQADHMTPAPERVEALRRRLDTPSAVILSVGLTRGYPTPTEPEPVHWLQVNNIHLEADPTWRMDSA